MLAASLLAVLATARLATAAVSFERAPEKDETEPLGPDPQSVVAREEREWRQKLQRRAIWAGVDAVVRAQAPTVDACVAAAGAPAAVSATVDLSIDLTGMAKVRPAKGADPVLAGCLVVAFDGKPLAVLIARALSLTYTARWDGVAAPVAPAPTTPAPAGSSPLVDAEPGFGAFTWGAASADFEELSPYSSTRDTRFYTRLADYETRWLGIPVNFLSYGFGASGFYAVNLGITGTTAQWRMREALVARYGPSHWDTGFGAYYWRGERTLVQLQPVAGSEDALLTIVDIERTRQSGLTARLPGDRTDATGADTNRRLPKIFKDDK